GSVHVFVPRAVWKRGVGRSGVGSGAWATDGGAPTPHSPFPTPRRCEPDDAGIRQDLPCDAAHPLAPAVRPGRVADGVLPDLDDRAGYSALGAVLPQAVAFELAGVGLVLAH